MAENSIKESQDNIAVALERFNKEFQRMERSFERINAQFQKISVFINNQRRLFRK